MATFKFQTCVLLCFTLLGLSATANARDTSNLLRQYPMAGAIEVSLQTNIGISAASPYLIEDDLAYYSVEIVGSSSGVHEFTAKWSDDSCTFIIHPLVRFTYNEEVSVTIQAPLANGGGIDYGFSFHTLIHEVEAARRLSELDGLAMRPTIPTNTPDDTLPKIHVLVDHGATPGKIYLASFSTEPSIVKNYLLALDEHGKILKSKNLFQARGTDLKPHPNGLFTYFSSQWIAADSNWDSVATFPSGNGYRPDGHEFRLFPDGGYALLAVTETPLDSSQYQPGMIMGARVEAQVIQIFDAHQNLIFEWRGIDHFRITDAVRRDLTDSSIDFEHSNALEFDPDGNVIISNRHLSEISKISTKTGKFIWRLGGMHNQFKLLGDSVWFSYQHAVRLLPNGDLTLFDNSDFDTVAGNSVIINHTRALELRLDTSAMTATAVWQFHHNPATYSIAMGYVQRLPNGNTLIGWGWNPDYAVTEVDSSGQTLFECSLDSNLVSYRAYKDPVIPNGSVSATADSKGSITGWFVYSPTSSAIHAELPIAESVHVEIRDVLGRLVAKEDVLPQAGTSITIPIVTSRYIDGTYYCTLKTANGASGVVPFVITQ